MLQWCYITKNRAGKVDPHRLLKQRVEREFLVYIVVLRRFKVTIANQIQRSPDQPVQSNIAIVIHSKDK